MGSHFGKGSSRNPAAGTDTEIAREQTKMRVAIEPRKATDRGGYYCMPLKVNVPTGRKDWKLTSAAPQVANASMYLVSSQVSIPPQG